MTFEGMPHHVRSALRAEEKLRAERDPLNRRPDPTRATPDPTRATVKQASNRVGLTPLDTTPERRQANTIWMSEAEQDAVVDALRHVLWRCKTSAATDDRPHLLSVLAVLVGKQGERLGLAIERTRRR